MARTIGTRSLFTCGYTVEPNPLVPTALYVFDYMGSKRYSVDPLALTCECDDFRFHCHRPAYQCKHLRGLAMLVNQQIHQCYEDQKFFARADENARTFRQRTAAKDAGQRCLDLATQLENLRDDLGLVVAERIAA